MSRGSLVLERGDRRREDRHRSESMRVREEKKVSLNK